MTVAFTQFHSRNQKGVLLCIASYELDEFEMQTMILSQPLIYEAGDKKVNKNNMRESKKQWDTRMNPQKDDMKTNLK